MAVKQFEVIIIGAGQSGMAVAYYLRRTGLSYIMLDNQDKGGGAWQHTWQSLRLFSPAQWSSLPGMIMPGGSHYYPTRDETIEYLEHYAAKYDLSVARNIEVISVLKTDNGFDVHTSQGTYSARVVVSATGTFSNPFTPAVEGLQRFKGGILHSSKYSSPEGFRGRRVAIIGEGNSGAQILAEVSNVAETIWITRNEPRFLPDHIDGRYLFDAATQMYEAQKAGRQYRPPSLGDIVMVDTVKDARDRGVLQSHGALKSFTETAVVLERGGALEVDDVIFCTGFKPALKHLLPLNVIGVDGKSPTDGTRSTIVDGLWLVGYGSWTGFASATLIGVGRSAKRTVEQIVAHFEAHRERLKK